MYNWLAGKKQPPRSSLPFAAQPGKEPCPYCHAMFSPQGLPSHVRKHQNNGDAQQQKKQKTDRRPKVKLRTENSDGTLTTLTEDQSIALLRHEKGLLPEVAVDEEDEEEFFNAMEDVEESDEVVLLMEKPPADEDEVDGADVEEVGDAPAADQTRETRARNWRVSEKAEVLVLWNGKDGEDGMKATHSKKKFFVHIKKKYKLNLQRNTFNHWLNIQEDIMASGKKTKADRRSQSVPREVAGKYPDMECILAGCICGLRDMGLVVETWMVNAEARTILHETYPFQFPDPSEVSDDDVYPFKCSDGWRKGFFNRHNFSVKSIGKKFNVKATSEEKMNSIAEFHIDTRVLQLSIIRDPIYGFTSPYDVFSHDQVPIELENSNGTTVHDTGDNSVYDALGKVNDTKRFCTLNLFGAMEYREDGKNVPKPHLVFHGAFKSGCDWHDKEEIEQWDPRVYVSFQENGWVDARTHQLGLENVLGPINDHLKEEGMEGVAFEDNLSAHKTEAIMQLWDNSPSLSNFIRPRFVPPNLTDIVQVIDRHIGIIYKRAVYRAFRAEYMKLYRQAKAGARKSEDIKVRALTPREKRIITTKAIADCHAKLTDPTCTTYRRAFIATATWMPVNHLYEDEVLRSPFVPDEESQVQLQHLDGYNYQERCSSEKVKAAVKAATDEEEKVKTAEAERAKLIADGFAAEIVGTQQFADKAVELMPLLLAKVTELVSETLSRIHQETGHERYLIGGSWAAAIISKALDLIATDNHLCHLEANDIDVYYDNSVDEPGCKLIVDLSCINYLQIDFIDLDVNTIKCSNLSPDTFLANNDINVTACCFNVDFASESDDLVSIHASPCFWQFIFESNANRKLRVVKPYDTSEYEATTLVRMAFKAFELGFPFTFDDIDPTVGTIAASQKRKFDQMKAWNDSPFHAYQCNKASACYKIAKKHTKENCVQCLSNQRNKKCTSKMCKQCCAAHGAPVCRAHGKK